MTNVNLLSQKIQESGYKKSFLAEKCGICYQAFINRMKGIVEFRIDEIRVLRDILKLSDREVIIIFLS